MAYNRTDRSLLLEANIYHPYSSKEEYEHLWMKLNQLMPYIEVKDSDLCKLTPDEQDLIAHTLSDLLHRDFKPLYLLHMSFMDHRRMRAWARKIYQDGGQYMPPSESMPNKVQRLCIYYHIQYLLNTEWVRETGMFTRRKWNIFS